jgi:HEAT repeat protein
VEGEPWFPDRAAALGRSTWGLTAMNVLMLQGDFAGLLAGFEVQNPYPHIVGATGPEIADAFVELLDAREGNQPFFAWTMLMDPHAPYEGDPQGPPLGTSEQDLYDGDVRSTDRSIGGMLDALRERGLAASTVVVVHGDHGEEFGEHGGKWHYTSVYDEQVRVPLILHVPGLGFARHAAPVDISDLAPTLCEILGDEAPWPGSGDSLVPLLLGEPMESYAFSEVLYPRRPEAVRRALVGPKGHKLILRGARRHPELYDLRADPRESRDLGQDHRGYSELNRILRGVIAREPDWQADFPDLPKGPIPSPPDDHRSDRELLREVLRQEVISDDHLELAMAALRRLGDRDSAVLAARHLDHPDPEMRGAVLGVVAAFRVKEALGDVLPLVEDANPEVRLQAIRTLGVLGAPEALAVLGDRRERSLAERFELALARAELGDREALHELLPLLDPGRPLEAARVLAKIRDPDALRACLLVTDTPRDLQLGALLMLLGSRDSVAWDFVCRAAEERSLPAPLLVEALQTPFTPIPRDPLPARRRALLAALGHPHPAVRHASLLALSELWPAEELGAVNAAWQTLRSALSPPWERDAARALLHVAKADPDPLETPAPPTSDLQIDRPRLCLPSLAPRFPLMLSAGARGDPGTGAEIVAEYLPSSRPPGVAGAATVTFDERGTAALQIALAARREAATGLRIGRRLPSGEIEWLSEIPLLR